MDDPQLGSILLAVIALVLAVVAAAPSPISGDDRRDEDA
jgi:hypothetical protein